MMGCTKPPIDLIIATPKIKWLSQFHGNGTYLESEKHTSNPNTVTNSEKNHLTSLSLFPNLHDVMVRGRRAALGSGLSGQLSSQFSHS